MADARARLAGLTAAVRGRPAMYFGNGAPTLIPAITIGVLDGVLNLAHDDYKGPIKIDLRPTAGGQVITFLFSGAVSRELSPKHCATWVQLLAHQREGRTAWQIGCAACASHTFELGASDGKRMARLHIVEGARVSSTSKRSRGAPFLRIRFRPDAKIFGHITAHEVLKIAGAIRDHAALHPGLFISFKHNAFPGERGYYYPEGLKSLLFEADYQRHSLHLGCLSFQRRTKQMSVEGHLRMVHAGVPFVWNYVNFKPTQGGAHLEGLGDALRDLFPDSTRGCRELDFVTNSDTGTRIKVPHSFIGALHFQGPARYRGPTKDVLIGDDVREFVHKAASAALRRQWNDLEKRRWSEIKRFHKKSKASGQ